MRKKNVPVHETVPLKLTVAERSLLLKGVTCRPSKYSTAIRATPASEPVMLTLDELEGLGGFIAAEANHTRDKKLQKKLDAIFQKIQRLLETHTDEDPPETLKIADAKVAKMIADKAGQIAEWTGKVLITAERLGIKNKSLEHFWLSPAQRDVLLLAPKLPKAITGKLRKKTSTFTVAEVFSMMLALAEQLPKVEARKQTAILLVAKHLMERLQEGTAGPAKPKGRKGKEPKTKAVSKALYQFKITLKDSKPPIWRRIQVKDCTLDKLHEHIQTAMGWTNSHLHRFEINGKPYGDPALIEEDFEEYDYVDSTRTKISQIVPEDGKPFTFLYEYDFGDGWQHEILFEGWPSPVKGKKYPLCVEGARACPPEDVGGVWGYAEYLEALADPKHERHEELLEWAGPFDPELFDAEEATKMMREGLPDWRG